jgi:hypothetical protein
MRGTRNIDMDRCPKTVVIFQMMLAWIDQFVGLYPEQMQRNVLSSTRYNHCPIKGGC